MNTHILYLNILILSSTINISSLAGSVIFLFWGRDIKSIKIEKMMMIINIILLLDIICMVILNKNLLLMIFGLSPLLYVLFAFPVAIIFYFIELNFNYYIIMLQGKKVSRKSTINDSWNFSNPLQFFLLMLLVVIAEEFIFRLAWFSILINTFNMSLVSVIFLGALAYGLNHSTFGVMSVISKTLCGIGYGVFYALSGHVLIVPILIHFLHNLIIFFFTWHNNHEN